MKDELWSRDEVDSPCLKICALHPGESICVGCYRTLEEIIAWSQMTKDQRTGIRAELPGRASNLKKRRGGRAARLAGKTS